jgi:hypothetical protein
MQAVVYTIYYSFLLIVLMFVRCDRCDVQMEVNKVHLAFRLF